MPGTTSNNPTPHPLPSTTSDLHLVPGTFFLVEGFNVLVAVGERLNASRWSAAATDAERELWRRDPLKAALMEEAMPSGSLSRARLSHVMGIHPDRVVNLLEPSRTVGAWSTVRARDNGEVLLAWAEREGHRLLLLGRRVAAAFGVTARVRWGTEVVLSHVHCMVLPHPSGRSRVLNDEATRHVLQERVAAFAAR